MEELTFEQKWEKYQHFMQQLMNGGTTDDSFLTIEFCHSLYIDGEVPKQYIQTIEGTNCTYEMVDCYHYVLYRVPSISDAWVVGDYPGMSYVTNGLVPITEKWILNLRDGTLYTAVVPIQDDYIFGTLLIDD